jgi:hypothetical protein
MTKITPAQARAIFDALIDDKGRFGKLHLRTYGVLKDNGFAEFRASGRIFVTEAGYMAARIFYGWETLRGATMGTAWTNKQQSEQDARNRQRWIEEDASA